jgi:hypothetical protein
MSWSSAYNHDVVFYNNVAHDNGDWHAEYDQDYHGMRVGKNCSYIWIVDNEMYHNSGDGLQINPENAAGQPTTHHIYVGRNLAWENKQTGLWTKQAEDVIFSQNVVHSQRPIGTNPSALGAGMGFQYGPERVWFLYNHIYNCSFGIQTNSTSGLGTGTKAYFIGNLIHNIYHDQNYSYYPDSAWSNAAIMLMGVYENYVINNTIYNVDGGIYSPKPTGQIHIASNIISNIREAAGQHIFLEFADTASGSTLTNTILYQSGNGDDARIGWGAGTRNLTGVQMAFGVGQECFVRNPMFVNAATEDFHLQNGSPAVDAGIVHEVYNTFVNLYGIDIARDFDGNQRPKGAGYDVGAYEQ